MKSHQPGILILITAFSFFAHAEVDCRQIVAPGHSLLEKVQQATEPIDVNFVKVSEGVEERAIRAGRTAGHFYLNRGVNRDPYLFTALPEGNTGLSLFLKCDGGRVQSSGGLKAVVGRNGLHGTEITIESTSKSVKVTDFNLGSMRVTRDMELGLKVPKEVQDIKIEIENGILIMRRRSLNNLVDYVQQIIPGAGTVISKSGGSYVLTSTTKVQFTVQALTNETPLTPMKPEEVFTREALAKIPPEKLQTLMFLLTREKFMAGSPRYLSKFGRDSIYTTYVLFDLLKPAAIEAILNGTLSSMNAMTGQVSHEQHEGDFASYERMKAGLPYIGINTPIEDYKMIDTEPATVILVAKFVQKYPERIDQFLKGHDLRGVQRGKLVKKLFTYVTNMAEPFRENPVFSNLIRLHEGETTGEWRDSDDGLGGGVYPFDVSAAFMPGALRALRDIYQNPATPLFSPNQALRADQSFQVWNTQVLQFFETRVTPEDALAMGESYLRSLNVPSHSGGLPPRKDLVFPVISLDSTGKQVRVMHSDDSLMMVFGEPSVEFLQTVSDRILINFPYGLGTPVGTLIANPAFASADVQEKFADVRGKDGKLRERYHRYTWKMQEDMYISGFNRQLQRGDLPSELREQMTQAREKIRNAIRNRNVFMKLPPAK